MQLFDRAKDRAAAVLSGAERKSKIDTQRIREKMVVLRGGEYVLGHEFSREAATYTGLRGKGVGPAQTISNQAYLLVENYRGKKGVIFGIGRTDPNEPTVTFNLGSEDGTPHVSSLHAALVVDFDERGGVVKARLMDLGSTNGTYTLNSGGDQWVRLSPGQEVDITSESVRENGRVSMSGTAFRIGKRRVFSALAPSSAASDPSGKAPTFGIFENPKASQIHAR